MYKYELCTVVRNVCTAGSGVGCSEYQVVVLWCEMTTDVLVMEEKKKRKEKQERRE